LDFLTGIRFLGHFAGYNSVIKAVEAVRWVMTVLLLILLTVLYLPLYTICALTKRYR